MSDAATADTSQKDASAATAKANAAVKSGVLDFSDRQSFDDAQRGFIATLDPMTITRESDGKVTYDLEASKFLAGDAPDHANPSLWRQAQRSGAGNQGKP